MNSNEINYRDLIDLAAGEKTTEEADRIRTAMVADRYLMESFMGYRTMVKNMGKAGALAHVEATMRKLHQAPREKTVPVIPLHVQRIAFGAAAMLALAFGLWYFTRATTDSFSKELLAQVPHVERNKSVETAVEWQRAFDAGDHARVLATMPVEATGDQEAMVVRGYAFLHIAPQQSDSALACFTKVANADQGTHRYEAALYLAAWYTTQGEIEAAQHWAQRALAVRSDKHDQRASELLDLLRSAR